jgi:hypothetical protein
LSCALSGPCFAPCLLVLRSASVYGCTASASALRGGSESHDMRPFLISALDWPNTLVTAASQHVSPPPPPPHPVILSMRGALLLHGTQEGNPVYIRRTRDLRSRDGVWWGLDVITHTRGLPYPRELRADRTLSLTHLLACHTLIPLGWRRRRVI